MTAGVRHVIVRCAKAGGMSIARVPCEDGSASLTLSKAAVRRK
jgi:hypothetical protein